MDTQYMKAYTIKEVSKLLNVPPGTLRQWEKDLNGLLLIPRSKQGARFYTEHEIALLEKVKQMRDKNLSKEMIRDLMQKHMDLTSEAGSEASETALAPVHQETGVHTDEHSAMDAEQFMVMMENFKDSLITDVRNEIRNGIRKEVLEEVKKEISKGSLHTVKSLSDSIYKSGEKTKSEIENLSGKIQQSSEDSSEAFGTLSKRVAKSSKRTSDQIHQLTNKLAESSEASSEEFKTMIHYISSSAEVTSTEISSLIETLNTDREIYIETINKEREQYWHEVKQREEVFQDMIVSFRNAAAAQEQTKKWWEIWK
ncbi:MerR family transcriptional regulator [Bacillus sp. ISL-47]|uniref:MerR family transcriptional regulator n=1 Tax=Bacillus sp. ISL-47 TaxID=2819130 RepID=UPI001BEC220D|nr:MerR family transcriptional regulator [Bacillus sp. ISL-47]MBT2689696.1 MerR family transcriptional regulator [Bacillus sp. ISL-47]MBT2710779.1 MerR family transcriptional regulator [Pseudomonas sp. ISL-84]